MLVHCAGFHPLLLVIMIDSTDGWLTVNGAVVYHPRKPYWSGNLNHHLVIYVCLYSVSWCFFLCGKFCHGKITDEFETYHPKSRCGFVFFSTDLGHSSAFSNLEWGIPSAERSPGSPSGFCRCATGAEESCKEARWKGTLEGPKGAVQLLAEIMGLWFVGWKNPTLLCLRLVYFVGLFWFW